ncbi:NAD(P)-binding protein [Setomelanomma holmii]|uniref:NAD(P)-binding protein n=1 Tax=Setomelanomma holmii TaxID=210430 RepID=A0A9P4H5Q6_9PLEO|nr:NAD(P)-binding protein [Setomelanomma holmii]
MNMNRKTCLVTGCSSGGVGAALAQAFADNGYHIFATARTPSKVPESLRETSNVTVLALDVTSSESIAAAAKIVHSKTGGRLDVLINNAGHGLNMPAMDTSINEARKLFDANFFGVLEVIQAFQHMLIKAKGCIVNNSSLGGYQPFPFITLYQASKAALTIAGEGWRLELAPLGVRVITLVTGGIATKFVDNTQPVNLPEDSYYASIKDVIEHQPEHIPFGMKPEVFASDILRRVERGNTGKAWVGGGSVIARIAFWVFPQWALVGPSVFMVEAAISPETN